MEGIAEAAVDMAELSEVVVAVDMDWRMAEVAEAVVAKLADLLVLEPEETPASEELHIEAPEVASLGQHIRQPVAVHNEQNSVAVRMDYKGSVHPRVLLAVPYRSRRYLRSRTDSELRFRSRIA